MSKRICRVPLVMMSRQQIYDSSFSATSLRFMVRMIRWLRVAASPYDIFLFLLGARVRQTRCFAYCSCNVKARATATYLVIIISPRDNFTFKAQKTSSGIPDFRHQDRPSYQKSSECRAECRRRPPGQAGADYATQF